MAGVKYENFDSPNAMAGVNPAGGVMVGSVNPAGGVVVSNYPMTTVTTVAAPPPYHQAQMAAARPPVPFCHKVAAIVCGTAQVVLGIIYFIMGIVFCAEYYATVGFGIGCIVICIFSVIAGAFGIQSGRTGGKCPTVATMVMSILAAISAGVTVISGSSSAAAFKATWWFYEQHATSSGFRIYVDWKMLYGAAVAIAIVSFAEFAIAVVQSGFSCAMCCSCCKKQQPVVVVA